MSKSLHLYEPQQDFIKKPLIVVLKPGTSAIVFEWTRQLHNAFQKVGLPAYKSFGTAIKAASKHIEYTQFKSSITSAIE